MWFCSTILKSPRTHCGTFFGSTIFLYLRLDCAKSGREWCTSSLSGPQVGLNRAALKHLCPFMSLVDRIDFSPKCPDPVLLIDKKTSLLIPNPTTPAQTHDIFTNSEKTFPALYVKYLITVGHGHPHKHLTVIPSITSCGTLAECAGLGRFLSFLSISVVRLHSQGQRDCLTVVDPRSWEIRKLEIFAHKCAG